VQNTVTAEAGTAEITEIDKVTANGRDIYRVRFRDPVTNPTLYVADDGTLATRDAYNAAGAPGANAGTSGSGAFSSLPPAVQKALEGTAPGATITGVRTSQHTVYEISFKDPYTHPTLLITEDGTLVRAR
jgi:hypothetical protein